MQETLFFTDRISARKGRAVQQQHFERCDSCGGTIHQQGQQQDRKGRCSERPSYHPRGGESDAPPNPPLPQFERSVCGKKFTLLRQGCRGLLPGTCFFYAARSDSS
jgi:hypothetical protein